MFNGKKEVKREVEKSLVVKSWMFRHQNIVTPTEHLFTHKTAKASSSYCDSSSPGKVSRTCAGEKLELEKA